MKTFSKIFFSAIIFFGLFALAGTSLAAKDLYVDVNGLGGTCNDSLTRDQNSIIQPFCSAQRAADVVEPGDTVQIRAGTYLASINMKKSGTEGQPITFKNYGDEQVIIDASNKSFGVRFEQSGLSYITVQGLHITKSLYHGIAILGAAAAHNITISKCKVYEHGRFGIFASDARYITIIDNEIYRNSRSTGTNYYDSYSNIGIYHDCRYVDIIGNKVYDAGGISIKGYNYGSELYPRHVKVLNNEVYNSYVSGIHSIISRYVLIEGNTVYSNNSTGIQIETDTWYQIVRNNNVYDNDKYFNGETGIWIDESRYYLVENNTCYNNQYGYIVTQSWYGILRNNLSYNNQAQQRPENNKYSYFFGFGAGKQSDHLPEGSQHNRFVHNTSFGDGYPGRTEGAVSISASDKLSKNVFKNNIISNTNLKYEADFGTVVYPRFSVFNNNIYYNPARALKFRWGGTDYNFSDWKNASGFDVNSTDVNPLFVNDSSLDFRLQSNSPAKDAAAWLTTTVGSGTNSSVMTVADARYFFDGYGIANQVGDTVQLEGQSVMAIITAVNYDTNTLTLDRPLSWTSGKGVSYVYSGTKPDIGAYEYASTDTTPPAAPTGVTVQ